MTYGKKGQLLIFFSIKKKKAIYKILDWLKIAICKTDNIIIAKVYEAADRQ